MDKVGKIPPKKYAFFTGIHRLLPTIRRAVRHHDGKNADENRAPARITWRILSTLQLKFTMWGIAYQVWERA